MLLAKMEMYWERFILKDYNGNDVMKETVQWKLQKYFKINKKHNDIYIIIYFYSRKK